jgi:isoquinoline 1-oxidoreductase beta subunit
MPADFSSAAWLEHLASQPGTPRDDEHEGDVAAALASAKSTVEASYHNQYLNHAQLEPPSATARFNPDGTLEVWLPNQAPDMFRDDIAKRTGLDAAQITLHSPLLGGFFGRHFLRLGQPLPAGHRPGQGGWAPGQTDLEPRGRVPARCAAPGGRGEVPRRAGCRRLAGGHRSGQRHRRPDRGPGRQTGRKLDPTALEGLSGKSYAIANKRIAQIYVKGPAMLGYWRSVGNSLNDFFYERSSTNWPTRAARTRSNCACTCCATTSA